MANGVKGWIAIGFFALVVMTMATGCCHRHLVRRHQANNPKTVTAEDRIVAMMSVHAHAYNKVGILPMTPEALDLPSLNRTVAILTTDRDPFATSRARRAVAQLAAYGGKDEKFVRAWHSILGDDAGLMGAVERAIHLGGTWLEIETRVYNILSTVFTIPTSTIPASAIPSAADSPPTSCVTKDPDFVPPVWQPNNQIDVKIEITVANASPGVIAQRIDPQNWDCPMFSGPFFASAYLTTDTPSPATTCPIPNPAVPPDPADNNSKPFGSRYDAMLFEDFLCPGSCNSQFKNLLRINTVLTDSSGTGSPCQDAGNTCDGSFNPANPVPYEACYSLGGGGQALVGCIGSQLVHLTVDQGALTACDVNPDTRVVSRKGIKFQETTVNAAYAYALLWVGYAEATQMLAEVVCCLP